MMCIRAGLVMRLAQSLMLDLGASSASAEKVRELLRRISLDSLQDLEIPCCTKEEDLPQLFPRLTVYTWSGSEASQLEIDKGRR